jgi:hypothetical protein
MIKNREWVIKTSGVSSLGASVALAVLALMAFSAVLRSQAGGHQSQTPGGCSVDSVLHPVPGTRRPQPERQRRQPRQAVGQRRLIGNSAGIFRERVHHDDSSPLPRKHGSRYDG